MATVVRFVEPKRRSYEKLNRFFDSLPSEQRQVALSLSDLGRIVGAGLPKTAFGDQAWWANTTASPQGKSWMSAGWRVESLYLQVQIAVFRRRGQDRLTGIRRYVRFLLEGAPGAAHPYPDMLADWLRFCARVGWYFEGTVLYERGRLSLESRSEAERAGVEEDYETCKRELARYRTQGPSPVLQSNAEGATDG